MSIKKLDSSVISKLRSSFNVNSASQCIVELVCNCLDAKSTAVAVRINLITHKVQVADNGEGISRANLEFVATRYATNKCRTVTDLERHLKTYGFRGEALASIVEMSDSVHINTRHKDSSSTFTKTMSKAKSEIKEVKQRPSIGTTVTVFGWLSAVPVRRQRVVPEVELEEIKRHLESLIVINPNTSFTLRNDATGTMLLSSPKHDSIMDAFKHLHPDLNVQFTLLKAAREKISVEAMIQKEPISSKNFQYLFVNKKPVKSLKVAKHVNKAFNRKMTRRGKDPTFYNTKQHPVYIMHIKCPQKCIDSIEGEVELTYCWGPVLACIDKLLNTLLEIPQKNTKKHEFKPNKDKENLYFGASQLEYAVQATAYKRKAPANSDIEEEIVISATPVDVKPKKSGFKRTQTTGDYKIQDSEPKKVPEVCNKTVKSIIKKPLGISVKPAGESVANFDQRSVYSRLTTDENKGKDLIMDMFLKSTQVYKEDDQQPVRDDSKETVEESNFMYSNNVRDHVRGIDATMSISVNVKKRKLNHKKPPNVQTNLTKQKSFQTEISEKLNEFTLDPVSQRKSDYTILIDNVQNKQQFRMVRKSKDAISEEWPEPFKPLNICHCEEQGNMFHFGGDEEEEFKKPLEPKLAFKGVRREAAKPPKWNQCYESPFFRKKVSLKCCEVNQQPNSVNNSEFLYWKEQQEKCFNNHQVIRYPGQVYFMEQNQPHLQNQENNNYNPCFQTAEFCKEPYQVSHLPNRPEFRFQHHKDEMLLNDHFINPYLQRVEGNEYQTQREPDFRMKECYLQNNYKSSINEPDDVQKEYLPRPRKQYEQNQLNANHFNEQTFPIAEQLENQKPTQFQYPKEPSNNHQPAASRHLNVLPQKPQADVAASPDLFPTNPSEPMDLDQFCDLATFGLITPPLPISLPDTSERLKMVENEPLAKLGSQDPFSFESVAEEKSRILVDSQNEWMRQRNDRGRKFFVNKRTGVVTVNTPTIPNDKFVFEQRLGFIPKGLSPIMLGHKEVDKSLSQHAKTKLHDMILQGYEDELLFIKWKHFIKDQNAFNPKAFFEQIYRDMSKQYERCVPVIGRSDLKLPKDMHDFNVNLFGDMMVLGQVDKKFICALSGDVLVMFDQHAVHERIKVEKYVKEYKGLKSPNPKKITIFLPHNDLALLKTHQSYLDSLGLGVEFFSNGVHLTGMPLCLKEKFSQQEDLDKILNLLIKDTLDFLKSTRGSAIDHLPKIIQNVINHKACRSAIKFGAELSIKKCQNLLTDLAKCQLPFQCAHGRPTLAPILDLKKVPEITTKKVGKVNLRKLLDRRR